MTKVLRYGQEYEKPVVLAMGFFDCVHLGHAKVIGEARRLANLAGAECAVLTFSNDPSARLGKGKQIYTLRDRLEVFASLGADAALVADFDDSFMATSAHDFTDTLSSTLHLVGLTAGEDYTYGAKGAGDIATLGKFADGLSIPFSVVSLLGENGEKYSSTALKTAVAAGDFPFVNARLTQPYFMRGTVTHAHGRGSGYGFPTANIALPEDRLSPAEGVYATTVTVDGKTYLGGTNVGKKPTFGDDVPSVETFVIDYDGNLYGKELKLCFFKLLRGVRKFDSAEALAGQLNHDMQEIKELLS